MNREEIDALAKNILLEHKNILFQWATGCGKTKQAIQAIDLLDKNKTNRILIVIAEKAHRKNWTEEFKKWNNNILDNLNYDITMVCYDSLHHHQNEHFDVVIFDESHHLGTDIRLDILRNVISDKFILLSATMNPNIIYEISKIIGNIFVSTITLQQAIDWGIIPEPKIILIPLTLDNKVINQEIEEVRGKKDKLVTVKCSVAEKWKYIKDKKKYPNLRLIISCTERQKYNDLEVKMDYYRRLFNMRHSESLKNKMLQYGSQRKVFLGQLKDAKAKEIISSFEESRYICFCSSIEQADRLGGSNSIHYKKENTQQIIDMFNNKEINSLYVVGMLREGQNLNEIEKGLIIQLDGTTLPFIQKSGRILRSENPEIYIIYFAGTQDEVYLNRALEHINPEYISYYENHN